VNATCTPSASNARTCACKPGFSGNGVTCDDVDECQSANGGCDANAICTNTTGSRSCACASGYTGNGMTCTLVPPPLPVSTWTFDKQSTATRIVDSRSSNVGTVVTGSNLASPAVASAPAFVTDHKGTSNGALHLDGVTSTNWVLVPNSSSLNSPWLNNAVTLTIWVRMNTVPSSGGVALVDRGGNEDTTTFGLMLFNAKPKLNMSNRTAQSSTNMPTGTWTFLAGVYNGVDLILYVNGDVASSFSNVSVPLVSLSSPLTIGAVRNVSGGYPTGFLDGDIDEVRLYGAALTAPQIKAVMAE
jgi:hypothetical protein